MEEKKIKSEETQEETQKERQKKETLRDYETRLEVVLEMKQMTDTKAWKDFYSGIMNIRRNAEILVLDEEKTRDIIKRQEEVKVVKQIIKLVQKSIENLNAYCNAMPLFRNYFHTNAIFNEALGIIEIKESE